VIHKTFRDVEIKSPRGRVSAVFSSFNVRDHDGDVTLPGAFEEGSSVIISSYNHTSWGGSRPVGKGVIRTTRSEAVVDGQFFMDTTDGRETFAVVKELAEDGLGEWSYGFEVLESEPGKHDGVPVKFLKRVRVFEVSPVLRGSGIATRTLLAKSRDVQDDDEQAQARVLVEYELSRYVALERGDAWGTLMSTSDEAELHRLASRVIDRWPL
jgi:hypothetical protein